MLERSDSLFNNEPVFSNISYKSFKTQNLPLQNSYCDHRNVDIVKQALVIVTQLKLLIKFKTFRTFFVMSVVRIICLQLKMRIQLTYINVSEFKTANSLFRQNAQPNWLHNRLQIDISLPEIVIESIRWDKVYVTQKYVRCSGVRQRDIT